MKPFLKWAGGKRWIASTIASYFPKEYNRYIEPFVGGGAVFFRVRPQRASLSDANHSLIETYQVVRDHPGDIHKGLSALHNDHSDTTYYRVRQHEPADPIARAVRFIYLNRTCWNGLYRVNRRNEFNVPIGTKSSVLFADDDFTAVSDALKHADLVACDFETAIDKGDSGDIIYVDPPYTVRHNKNGFLKYNKNIFSWEDQIRLRSSLGRAADRGCVIFISNADHESLRDLYDGFGSVLSLPRSSIIAGSSAHRGSTSELLVVRNG